MLVNTRAARRARPGRARRAAPRRHRAGHRARARAPRAPAAGRAAARRASPPLTGVDLARARCRRRDPRALPGAARPRATSPPPAPPTTLEVAPCLGSSRARARSPRRSRCAGPEVIAAYPISPQTHIVEGLSRAREDRARSRRASSSTSSPSSRRCRSASAPRRPGARTYTATASQGLLYMVEALYNAVRPRAADRHDRRQPRDRLADQHLERPLATRCRSATRGWIQLYAESNQEAVDLHVQAFRLAEELSLPVMVCMDGFILTHAVERVDVPDAGAGRRLPAAVRAAPGARPRRRR